MLIDYYLEIYGYKLSTFQSKKIPFDIIIFIYNIKNEYKAIFNQPTIGEEREREKIFKKRNRSTLIQYWVGTCDFNPIFKHRVRKSKLELIKVGKPCESLK